MKTRRPPVHTVDWSWSAIKGSFQYAWMGVCHALQTERNLQVHCFATVLFVVGCLVVRPSLRDVTLGVVMCCLVWTVELLNTAVERITDLTTGGKQHELAKLGKDVSAGAVLLTAFAALCVGYYLVVNTLPWHWLLLTTVNWEGAAESFTVLALVTTVVWCSRRSSSRSAAPQPDSSKEVVQ